MRKVIVRKYVKITDQGLYEKQDDGEGLATFHAWGVNCEEFTNGAGNFSTAIVERKDGTIENIPVDLIQFIYTQGT